MMQFVTLRQAQENSGGVIAVKQHWYLTEDRTRVVEEGHPDGRWLWAPPGMEVPLADAIRLGAVKVEEPEVAEAPQPPLQAGHAEDSESESDTEPPQQPKARKQAANKARAKGEDK